MKPAPENAADGPQQSEPTPIEGVVSVDPDRECAERAQRGDRDAMDLLVERHHAAVARLLWRFVRTQADLDDLVQDTFLRMVRGLPGWTPQLPFARWLLRIATNTGRDYFRRQAVRRRWLVEPEPTNGDERDSAVAPEPMDPALNPAARAAADEVKATLEHLTPDERTLLTLHHLEGWSLREIAGQFGWTLTATKLRAWRARRQLRAILLSSEPS